MSVNATRMLQFYQHFGKFYAQQFAPLSESSGLSSRELQVLLFLANNPSFDRAADIANLRQITKSHVSLSVTNLEQRGLLYRVFDPADRRTAHLKLTDSALPIVAEGNRIQQTFFGHVFAGLSQEEIAFWPTILDKVWAPAASKNGWCSWLCLPW